MPKVPAKRTTSSKGKKASEAKTAPRASSPAASRACRAAARRLVCPTPIPRVFPPLATTMALERACFTTFQANQRSRHSASVGAFWVTTLGATGS
jgi:hypothetical protein